MVALGDNFHDGGGAGAAREWGSRHARALQRGRDWIWITGNHDPDPADNIGGTFRASSTVTRSPSAISRRGADGEIAGHLHPVARVAAARPRGQPPLLRRRWARMVMPAFGAFTGGLNIRDRAFAEMFGTRKFTAHMLGEGRLYAFAAGRGACRISLFGTPRWRTSRSAAPSGR